MLFGVKKHPKNGGTNPASALKQKASFPLKLKKFSSSAKLTGISVGGQVCMPLNVALEKNSINVSWRHTTTEMVLIYSTLHSWLFPRVFAKFLLYVMAYASRSLVASDLVGDTNIVTILHCRPKH